MNLKKSWHPKTLHNQEKVWKRERQAEEEKKKLEQLRKEIQEERAREELQQLNASRSKTTKSQLDWMYTPSASSTNIVSEDKEAYLLGKKRIDKLVDSGASIASLDKTNVFKASTSTIYGVNANSDRDMQAKIRDDPLFMVKQREQAYLKAALQNPIQLRNLQKKSHEKKHHRDDKNRDDRREKRYKSNAKGDKSNAKGDKRDKSNDRQSKLDRMRVNAEQMEEERLERLKRVAESERLEDELDRRIRSNPSTDFHRQAYSQSTISEMIQRNKGK